MKIEKETSKKNDHGSLQAPSLNFIDSTLTSTNSFSNECKENKISNKLNSENLEDSNQINDNDTDLLLANEHRKNLTRSNNIKNNNSNEENENKIKKGLESKNNTIKNKKESNIQDLNKFSNNNILDDIGLLNDLVPDYYLEKKTDCNQKSFSKSKTESKKNLHIKKSSILIDFEDDEMLNLSNPNFDSTDSKTNPAFDLNEKSSDHEQKHENVHEHEHKHGHSHDHVCRERNTTVFNTEINRTETEIKIGERRRVDSKNDHCHVIDSDQSADLKRNVTVWRKLITVLIMCIVFMIGEIIGGILARSISIQTDAAHMAADIAGFFFSIVAIYVSGKEPTRRMSFGYYRSEVLGALFSTLIIWILTGVLVYLAVLRIINNEYEIESVAMVVTASCGVLFNIIMYFVLHTNRCFNGIELSHHGHSHSNDNRHGHSHSGNNSHDHIHEKKDKSAHGHSHNKNTLSINAETTIPIENFSEEISGNKSNDSSNINLRAAAIHVIGDFIQSIGVLIASLIIYFKPEYKIADPICTFIFSALVILTTAPILRDIYYVLMEALPVNLNYDAVIADLCLINNVKKAHSLHIWCLTMEKFALSVHLVTESDIDTQVILKDANNLLRTKYKIEQTTIQVEYYDVIMDSCNKCKLPN